MGCSMSKLEDEEAVKLCKDRKNFIKQAVEQRRRLACGHLAYIQSLKRVSTALREYVDGYEPRELLLDSFITPPFTPVKKTSPGLISITPRSFPQLPIESKPNRVVKVNYLRSGGNGAVSVEERPQSPEIVRVQSYSPMHQYGFDGFFPMQSPPMNSSFFSYSPNNRPNIPPPSPTPESSQWDFFWNPFSSLDNYGYPSNNGLDHMAMDDEIRGLRQVREEEGIPELEEDETEQEDDGNSYRWEDNSNRVNTMDDRTRTGQSCCREEVLVEDVDEDEEDEDEDEDEDENEDEMNHESEMGHELQGIRSRGNGKIDVSRVQNAGPVASTSQESAVVDLESKDETPGFTVYVNRKPTNMAEVIKEIEAQFMTVCNSANEVSALLEARKAPYMTTSNELTAMKMLNPVALFRSASSRSSSSRFLISSSATKDESGYESTDDISEESSSFSPGHQSTLDRLYAWEKKLYQEVRSGEKIRIAYEKKCNQLRNQDVKGEDPSSVEKTRSTMRDLHTQIKVSIHSVEAVAKRIETLRDEELQPQLQELVQGLARMWKVMAECHQLQKLALDEAKLLLAGIPSKLDARKLSSSRVIEPNWLARASANLETELRNWRSCFESWIGSQRSYMHAITGWLLRCVNSDSSDVTKPPFSPRRSNASALPIFGVCIQWKRVLDEIQEKPVLDGLDFFAAGMGSLHAQQQQRDDAHRIQVGSQSSGGAEGSSGNMEMVEFGKVEDEMSAEKMAEVAIRVLCAGLSFAVSSLTEFAISSADGYSDLLKQRTKGDDSHNRV
ncbi:nitrate regulatory gene2 protein-like [Cucurbita pepo subsp. pepo]|uniref:nitrate regulatory gene2 protein-like n=1 Tax=Cucurbita pepo subsp. pepo TaxID=3664 RepID=UPI000C9D9B13|nr:nitrate regulatory gene2 protein-like [Cucurbita pepo subsp. pepo]XP_023537755.1 nitrate regulatory gene2 protein-like [Cucurbita pepo subsp. pepo]